MPRRRRKIITSRKARVLSLLESHGAKAVASEIGISVSSIYKIKRGQNHHKDLSEMALALAKNLER